MCVCFSGLTAEISVIEPTNEELAAVATDPPSSSSSTSIDAATAPAVVLRNQSFTRTNPMDFCSDVIPQLAYLNFNFSAKMSIQREVIYHMTR